MTGPRLDPRVGTNLGPYRIERVLGRGGMGVVYRATDTALDRSVALKLIAPLATDDETFRLRFLRESKMAAAIDHPNIIPIYEAGEVEGVYFLAMRYVDGTDLQHRLRSGPLAPRAAVTLLGQVASALDAAHEAGLVHRDVKPANLLVASGVGAERGDHVYLTDFGLTKESGSETGLTRAGGFVGTLEYIAPEQIEGKAIDGRADQYALAGIAVACLTGETPFPRDSDVALINAHLHDPPPSPHERVPELPAAVDGVIARGLAKDPADRYPDCRAFVEELRDALGVTGSQPRPTPGRSSARDRRLPLLIGGLIVASLLVVGGVVVGLGRGIATAPPRTGTGLSAAPSTEVEQSVAPTSTAFPDTAEGKLMAALDRAGIDTDACERGPYEVLASKFAEAWPAPIASVVCALDVESGANSILIRQFGPLGSGEGFLSAQSLESFVDYIADTIANAPEGDCIVASPAVGDWASAGESTGRAVCYTDRASGDAVLYWTYEDARVLVKAINQRGDTEALRSFFLDASRFIAP